MLNRTTPRSEDDRLAVITGHTVAVTDATTAKQPPVVISAESSSTPLYNGDSSTLPARLRGVTGPLIRAAEWSPITHGACQLLVLSTRGEVGVYREGPAGSPWISTTLVPPPDAAWTQGSPTGPAGMVLGPIVAKIRERGASINSDAFYRAAEVTSLS